MKNLCIRLAIFFIFLHACDNSTESNNENGSHENGSHENLVQNPGFEISTDGLRPDVWKDGTWYNPSTGGYVTNIIMDSIIMYNGSASGKIVFDPVFLPDDWWQANTEVEIFQSLDKNLFEVGSEYKISLWMRTGSLSIQAHIGRVGYWWGPFLPADDWLEENTEWAEYSATFTASEDDLLENPKLRIFIDWRSARTDMHGIAWIDDVEISKVTE